jgi:DNA-binding PadR family transcriptional regulator
MDLRYTTSRLDAFQILLSLTDGHLHGYGIIRDVAARTAGSLRLGTGTLYTALARLEALALVEKTDPRNRTKDDDERRRYYRLTPLGRAVLKAETNRLDALVRQARRKGIMPSRHEPRPALSKVERPALSRVEGPALSRVEGSRSR